MQKYEGFFLLGQFARLVNLIKRNGKTEDADNGQNVGGYPREHGKNRRRKGRSDNAFGY
ncbi:MAG: hypothetical protein ACR2P4_04885 [Gammaproteobacteria bacterium]